VRDRAARALASFERIYWIAGGRPKEASLDPLLPWLDRVRHAYLIGEAAAPFAAALALAEIPYALGAVFLGMSFVERRLVPLMILGVAGALLSVAAYRAYHRHLQAPPGGS